MKKGFIASLIIMILFLTSFSAYLLLRHQNLQASIDRIGHLYDIAYSMHQLQDMAEEMRGPMYHYLLAGLESSYQLLMRQKKNFGEALHRMEDELVIDDDFIDFYQEAKVGYSALEKELDVFKEKAESFPHAGSILAGSMDAKILAISNSLGTVLDWVDMAIEDTARKIRRASMMKVVKTLLSQN